MKKDKIFKIHKEINFIIKVVTLSTTKTLVRPRTRKEIKYIKRYKYGGVYDACKT